ncbi:phospholipid scramblase 2-like [Physella acuta]|uniref:phospholipid scramblase 2-like n=1 Tax=Physella acuta TaxID=109671 RepID=UPI0027DE0F48|nr:phospholipid scramblase 2-like [Physella acuta]
MSHPVTDQPGVNLQPMKPGYAPPPGQPPYGQPGYYPPPGQPGYPPPGQPGYPPPGQPGFAPGQYPPGYGQQPVVWMPPVEPVPNCPKGLEYLTQLDQVLIKQEVHLMEVVTNWECSNKYKIFNNQGQQCYYAFEKSNACARQCCGPNRGFKIHVENNLKEKIFSLKRPFKCCGGCNWCAAFRCFQDEVSVYAKDGTQLGYVRQACSFWKPHYTILDQDKDPKFEIWGPCCPCTACNTDVEFPVRPMGSETVVANITKQWSGFLQEYFTDADNFGVSFPKDLDVKLKATLMACVFLIDFMYFETAPNNQNHHHHY